MSIVDKAHTHDTVRVSKEGFVAIAEIKTPNLNVLIRTSGYNQLVVGRDGKRKNRQLVAIQGEEETQGIFEEDLQ